MLKTDGGLLSCWQQIVRKRGSLQKKKKKKKPCKHGKFGLQKWKRKLIKRKME